MDRGDALKELVARVPGGTLAARLRAIMPEIDRRIREGVRHDEIIAALNANGFALNLNTFRSYLYRYRKKAVSLGERPSPPARLAGGMPRAPSEPAVREARAAPLRDRPDLDAVLDAARRDELGETYLARTRPLFRPKREGRT